MKYMGKLFILHGNIHKLPIPIEESVYGNLPSWGSGTISPWRRVAHGKLEYITYAYEHAIMRK